nr:putative reverse transcriptase domain-containing protein [Tanacetum cinerariifolium]
VDDEVLDLSERNLKQCRRKICDGQYTAAMRVLSSSGVAPYNDATLQELKAKHPFKSAPSLPDTPIDHHHLIASETVVLDRIKSFLRGTSCGRDGLRFQDPRKTQTTLGRDGFDRAQPLLKQTIKKRQGKTTMLVVQQSINKTKLRTRGNKWLCKVIEHKTNNTVTNIGGDTKSVP